MVRDNELSVPILNSPSFVSPARLRAGVLPFETRFDVGAPNAGASIAELVTEEFSRNRHILMVPAKDIRTYAEARGIVSPITPEQAVTICRDLNLNLIMDGSLANMGQHQVRTGWRRLLRWFSNQQVYIEAILSITAYDPIDGSVITSRAGESRIRLGRAPKKDAFGADERVVVDQKSIEESLDEAISFLYLRSLEGLKVFPFKARIVSVEGNQAKINFGNNVKLKKKTEFAVLSKSDTIVNTINVPYTIPGPPTALLRVTSVSQNDSTLTIESGTVSPGDVIQSWEFD
jgi:hypothetical protein